MFALFTSNCIIPFAALIKNVRVRFAVVFCNQLVCMKLLSVACNTGQNESDNGALITGFAFIIMWEKKPVACER